MSHDEYKRLELPPGTVLEACPCCGNNAPELWQYSASETVPCTKAICCAQGDPIGPQDGIVNAGCMLFMPPDQHYRATIREAIKWWNEYAKALTALQRKNRWEAHKVLRDDPNVATRRAIVCAAAAIGEQMP